MAVFQQRSGPDVMTALNMVLDSMNSTYREQHMACLNNVFVVGMVDFRKTARCQVQNWLLSFLRCCLWLLLRLNVCRFFFPNEIGC